MDASPAPTAPGPTRVRAAPMVLPAVVMLAAVACILSYAAAVALTPVLGVVALLAARGGDGATADAALAWCLTSAALAVACQAGVVWPVPGLVAVLAFAALRWRNPVASWVRPGPPDRGAQLLAAASVPITTLALVVFIASGRADLARVTEPLQDLPLWLIVLAGVGFSLANPVVEEALFRGVLQPSLATAYGVVPGVVLQAVAFGAVHWAGVPGGGIGMVMAGGWALALGAVRHRSGNLRLVWLAHVAANVTIFATVVVVARHEGVL